jgi:hypothetical protein
MRVREVRQRQGTRHEIRVHAWAKGGTRPERKELFTTEGMIPVNVESIEDPTTSSLSLSPMAILFAIPAIGTRAFILPVSLVQRKALSDSEEKPTTWPRLLASQSGVRKTAVMPTLPV